MHKKYINIRKHSYFIKQIVNLTKKKKRLLHILKLLVMLIKKNLLKKL